MPAAYATTFFRHFTILSLILRHTPYAMLLRRQADAAASHAAKSALLLMALLLMLLR